ncbi:vWA domain-containing protein [Seonamhaeicola marinus]|uniref:VWA domain-containing protein n=1 Tax=Seonamhaeicola marinus TaxID=1912246 RepID=A0A5D0HEV2_9FLAO|nr:vWA domain-containing protein [Seonamhaeicola marinus]TYA69801.1 VWA domain-containing protein [Seonamhaeicola marinus]
MKTILRLTLLQISLFLFACTGDGTSESGPTDFASSEDASGGGGGGQQGQAGLVTAGEWNDLTNWDFWNNILNEKDYSEMPAYWSFYHKNRISFIVQNNNTPINNATIELIRNDAVIWAAKTDNFGKAELWAGIFQDEHLTDLNNLSLKINGVLINQNLVLFKDGINEIDITPNTQNLNNVELSFIVDATGSMGDELEFLKEDLKSVINKVKQDDANLDIFTSTVFYRDEGDAYVTKASHFTNDLDETIAFINEQSANGGGDFPEAVHSALDLAINDLQWSDSAKTRIAFLLLDAPPHYTPVIVENIQNTIKAAAKKGIKVIPITASGIDKNTEFLMRFMAISTNATYVFITNDSGIGNDHLEPSVGQYEVEKLNDLMVRLIKKYSE